MRLSELLGPHAYEGFVCSFCGGIDGLTAHSEPSAGGRYEDDASTLGQVRLGCFGEEDGPFDVGVKMPIVEIFRCVDQVRFIPLRRANPGSGNNGGNTRCDALVNENLNLACLADLESTVYQSRNLVQFTDVRLADDGFGAIAFDLLRYLLDALTAALGYVVYHHIGSAFSEQHCDTSTNPTAERVNEVFCGFKVV